MEIGQHGQHGPHAARPVDQAFKTTPEIVQIQLHQMEGSTVLEMLQKHKLATPKFVQLVIFLFVCDL